jgi:hypothetical protein
MVTQAPHPDGSSLSFRHALARFRSIISRKNRNEKSKSLGSSGIHKVPREIVQLILAFLSIPDQVCFALTCKSLLAAFQFFLEGEKLSLSRLLPRESRLALASNVDERPRVKLLHQLEDDRWKYCPDCWALHPPSACRPPRDRATHSIWQIPHSADILRPICMPYAGEVDICPCRRITFRDKQYIMAKPDPSKVSAADLSRILCYREFCSPASHECTLTEHPKHVIQVETTLWVCEKTQALLVLNRHRINSWPVSTQPPTLSFTEEDTPKSPLPDVLCFSQKTVRKFLQSLYEESGSSFVGWNKSPLCQLRLDVSDLGVSVSVVRSLGKDEWPDRIWARSCR